MKAQHYYDMYWTARLAPYLLCVAVVLGGFALYLDSSLHPIILAMATLSGALLFLFHFLRWRTGSEGFQVLAMLLTFVPFLSLVHRISGVEMFQYLAFCIFTYNVAILIFRRALREMKMDDSAGNS